MYPVTDAQKSFWNKLLDEKEFPPGSADRDSLKAQFEGLNRKSGSVWIDKALKLPDKGSKDETVTEPSF